MAIAGLVIGYICLALAIGFVALLVAAGSAETTY